MGGFAERLAIFVEANVGQAIAEFKKVGTAAEKAGVAGDRGAKGLGRFGLAGTTAGNLLKKGIAGIGVAGAGAAIVKFGSSGVAAFQELTGEIRKFQRVSGASAEDASKFVAVLHALGIEPDVASSAIFKLSSRIGGNSKALADNGIVVAKTRAGNVDLVGTILNIGDAYKATTDVGKRAKIVGDAFGVRGAQALLPLLGKTRSEIEAIITTAQGRGLIFSQEQINKGKEFAVATRELGESFKAVQVAAGEELVPVLTDLTIAITKVIDASHGDVGKGFKGLLLFLAGPLGPTLLTVGKGAKILADGEGELAVAAAEAAERLDEETKAADELKKTIFSATDAQRGYEAAKRSAAGADRALVDATADYNKLLKEGAVDEEKVADARRSLAEATRSVADANRGVAKAQREYDEAVAYAAAVGGLDSAMDLVADAGENLADAQDSAASASERATEATNALAKAQAGDPEFQAKLATAKQGVADATQGVADATYNLGQRSFENVAAHDAEAVAIGAKAGEVDNLRTSLEALLLLNPDQFAFLAPILAGLPSAGGGGMSGGVAAPSPAPAPPAAPLSAPSGGGTSNVQRIGDTIVNIHEAVTDPVNFAKKLVWNLN